VNILSMAFDRSLTLRRAMMGLDNYSQNSMSALSNKNSKVETYRSDILT